MSVWTNICNYMYAIINPTLEYLICPDIPYLNRQCSKI